MHVLLIDYSSRPRLSEIWRVSQVINVSDQITLSIFFIPWIVLVRAVRNCTQFALYISTVNKFPYSICRIRIQLSQHIMVSTSLRQIVIRMQMFRLPRSTIRPLPVYQLVHLNLRRFLTESSCVAVSAGGRDQRLADYQRMKSCTVHGFPLFISIFFILFYM